MYIRCLRPQDIWFAVARSKTCLWVFGVFELGGGLGLNSGWGFYVFRARLLCLMPRLCEVIRVFNGFHGRLLAAATLHKKLKLYTVLKAMSKKVEFSRQRARRPECVHTEIGRYKG